MSVQHTGSRTARPVQADVTEEQPLELAVIARHASVRVTLVRRYVEFGLFDIRELEDQR
jgi:hypothetical protein